MEHDNFMMMSRSEHRNTGGTFSSQSVLTAVQRFVNSVNTMNETIMVPSRLLDMDITSIENQSIPVLLRGDSDPFAVYGMLNGTKNDLMYGLPTTEKEELLKAAKNKENTSDRWSSPYDSVSDITSTINNSYNHLNSNSTTCSTNSVVSNNHASNSNSRITKPVPSRRTSTLSMISVNSSGSESGGESDIVEEASDEVDSDIGTDDSSAPESVAQASAQLREHLIGLYSSLTQLSEAAVYISDRYQEVISQ
uniref:Myb-like protein A n=2 Tax=Hirondellea gigas TaxID=1518452 RepID=A0A2P2HXQ8_9CRUS